MKFIPTSLEDNVNVPAVNHGREFFKFAGITATIVVGLYFVLGLIAENLATRLTPDQEVKVAQMFVGKIENDHVYPRTTAYAQEVLDRLVQTAKGLPPFPYKVYVIEKDQVNALALPAGHIVIFDGLIKRLHSENGLAGVIGHELGHYAHRDHLRGLGRGLITMVLAETLKALGQGVGIFTPSLEAMDMKFSRTQEAAADLYAQDLAVSAYGHSSGSAEIFDVMVQEEKKWRWLWMFSTHPEALWRKKTIDERARSVAPGVLTPLPSDKGLPFPEELKARQDELQAQKTKVKEPKAQSPSAPSCGGKNSKSAGSLFPFAFVLAPIAALALGAGLCARPQEAIELQRKFYARINWRTEPISMDKELRNTRLMGLFLIALSIVTLFYVLIKR